MPCEHTGYADPREEHFKTEYEFICYRRVEILAVVTAALRIHVL
jgi:hypothetical protein